jgi:hypothetical protein
MQIPSTKYQINPNDQNSKHGQSHQTIGNSPESLGHWAFEFGYCLEFVYWDLGF